MGQPMKTDLPRSALFMPGSNQRAIDKVPSLDCDAVILDLEDAVAPSAKDLARVTIRAALAQPRSEGFGARLVAVRTNDLDAPGFAADLDAAQGADVIVVPKVSSVQELAACQAALSAISSTAQLWVMIETAEGVLNIREIARQAATVAPSLSALIIGANDLAKDTGAAQVEGRWTMVPWFAEIVLAASAAGLGVLDSVSNAFRDLDAFAAECAQGAALGMVGKTLIHPAQIEPCNRAFGPKAVDIERAQAIVSAFNDLHNADKGAVQIAGEMVERLHLDGAQEVLRRATALGLI